MFLFIPRTPIFSCLQLPPQFPLALSSHLSSLHCFSVRGMRHKGGPVSADAGGAARVAASSAGVGAARSQPCEAAQDQRQQEEQEEDGEEKEEEEEEEQDVPRPLRPEPAERGPRKRRRTTKGTGPKMVFPCEADCTLRTAGHWPHHGTRAEQGCDVDLVR
jgi:hypothetical protein